MLGKSVSERSAELRRVGPCRTQDINGRCLVEGRLYFRRPVSVWLRRLRLLRPGSAALPNTRVPPFLLLFTRRLGLVDALGFSGLARIAHRAVLPFGTLLRSTRRAGLRSGRGVKGNSDRGQDTAAGIGLTARSKPGSRWPSKAGRDISSPRGVRPRVAHLLANALSRDCLIFGPTQNGTVGRVREPRMR